MKSNKHKATMILAIFTLGFLISYPFSKDSFLIGMFSAICAASMIGGLADWFAVTAIFRRPLGIYWPRKVFRTEIIPRNREGIINGLVDIVENDLLSKESVQRKIMDVKLFELFAQYIEEKTENGQRNDIVEKLLEQVYDSLEPSDVKALAIAATDSGKRNVDLYGILVRAARTAVENGYDNGAVDTVIDVVTGFLKCSKAHAFFTRFVEDILAEYEAGSSSRAMTIKMLMNFVLKKTPADLALMIENELVDAVCELRDEENSNRINIRTKLKDYVYQLEDNEEMKSKLNEWLNKNEAMLGKLIQKLVGSYEAFRQQHPTFLDSETGAFFNDNITSQLENLLKSSENEASAQKIDLLLKELIISFINKKHGTIGVIVKDRINQFSTEQLVELIENTAGDDLQMIRINGSIVGGLVGLLTYLLSFYIR